jgi:hypothetical protein
MKTSTKIGLVISTVWVVTCCFVVFEDMMIYDPGYQWLILTVPYMILWFVIGVVRHRYELDVVDEQDEVEG